MVMGVKTACLFCEEPGQSCVLPYVCIRCEVVQAQAELEMSALLNQKPPADSNEHQPPRE